MPGNSTRVVIDINLWVSMAMGSQIVVQRMTELLERSDIDVFVSVELLNELTDTLAKPKLQRYLTQARTKALFDLIWERCQLISVTSSVRVCRDEKDDFVLNLAIDADVHFIITGDTDLLDLKMIGTTHILTIGEFTA